MSVFGSFAPVLNNKSFFRLWLAQTISTCGDAVARIAVMLAITEHSSSPLALTGIVILQVVPSLVLGPIAGVYIDRWNRKTVLLASDFLRAAIVAVLVVTSSPVVILLVTAALATIGAFFSPARSAFVPDIVGEDQIMPANSLTESTYVTVSLIGPGLGGILIAAFGLGAAFAFDSATFILSGLLLLTLSSPKTARPKTAPKFVQEFKAGLGIICTNKDIRFVITLFSACMVTLGGFNVLLVDYLRNRLQVTPELFGLSQSLLFAGALPASLLVGYFSKRINKQAMLIAGTTAIGALSTLFFLRPTPFQVLVWCILLGAADGVLAIPSSTILLESTAKELRGRVMAVYATITRTCAVIGLGLSGLLASLVETHIVIAILGGLLSAVSLICARHFLFASRSAAHKFGL